MKIKTGGKELLESETFLALDLGETAITIGDSPEKLNFIFDFVEADGEKTAIKWDVVDGKSMKLTLTNWDNPLGTTLGEPVEVGILKNRKLFILFYIEKAGKAGHLRAITFSLYLGEEVQGGQN